jgi:hypothetical protein
MHVSTSGPVQSKANGLAYIPHPPYGTHVSGCNESSTRYFNMETMGLEKFGCIVQSTRRPRKGECLALVNTKADFVPLLKSVYKEQLR